jgi:hypothetical protein
MPAKEYPIYFLHSKVSRDDSSTPVLSSFSLEVLDPSHKERDGGLVVREATGGKALLRVKADDLKGATSLVLCAQQVIFGEPNTVLRKIDGVVSERIIEYVERYYGKYRTNCSTLVEYLRTGHFTECNPKKSHLVFSAGMNLYTTQRIEQGDSLCVLYYGKWVNTRRKLRGGQRNHYLQNRKHSDLARLGGKRKPWHLPPGKIVDVFQSTYFEDYHFMHCIGADNGKPILIHQAGFITPGEEKEGKCPSIVVTVGMINPYPLYKRSPSFMFIKKGRQKKKGR